MTRIRSFARIAAVMTIVAALAVPSFAARGSADFTRFVAIGDSYGAGFEAGSLNQNHQPFGWPAIIARQVGLQICPPTAAATDNCFAIPFISNPGLPGGELVFNGSTLVTVPGSGVPLMLGFQRPYNNLSVPGYTVGAVQALTGAEPTSGLGQVILRGLGTEVDQALALHPTFIAIWIGGNDFLGAVSAGDPTKLTPPATFAAQYKAMLDKLTAGAPNAGMVMGTLPASFAAPPLTSRLPAFVFDPNFQPVTSPLINNGAPIPLFYIPAGTTTPAPVPPGSIFLLSSLARYQQGFGIPPQLKGVPPFSLLPHTGEPLTDAEIITPAEQKIFSDTITAYNATITAEATARNIPLADIKGLFDRLTQPQVFGGVALTNTWISGGIFSNDGVHLTDIGYTLFANEYIKAINSGYNTDIPLASIAATFQNNGQFTGFGDNKGYVIVSPDAAAAMTSIFNGVEVPVPAPPRRRGAGH
jgi:lysophospholipase L1-like esterase